LKIARKFLIVLTAVAAVLLIGNSVHLQSAREFVEFALGSDQGI